jgi:hypothetical protein
MNSRSALTSMSLWVWLVSLAFAPLAARAEDPPKSCQETTERVLKPFLDRDAAAQEAAQQYEAQNTAKIAWINGQIRLRQEAKKIFDDARDKENENFGNRIRWGNEAIAEATADAQKRIAERRKRASEERAKGRERNAQAHVDAAAKIAAQLAAGKVSWYKKGLGRGHDVNGWRKYVAEQTKKRAERMAAYGAGEVSRYIKTLGQGMTWKGVQASTAKKREELAKAQKREYGYYLRAIGMGKTGEEIDDYVAMRQDELDDARARIAAGTFSLYVPVLGMGMDRNGVQKLVAEAREKYRQTGRAWGAKTYHNYNPKCGMGITNGKTEEIIAEKRQELTDFRAAGVDARVYAAGAGRSGRQIREQIGAAQAKGDNKAYDRWHEILAAWKEACAKWIANKQKDIQHWEEVLAKHEEVHKADLKKQKANIDGRLQGALNQTPCGGAGGSVDPDHATVIRQRQDLEKLTESDAEKKRRRDWYDDKIYIERDGTVHGDPREAWLNALRDTQLTDSQQKSLAERLLSIQGILSSKSFADWLAALKDANEMREATGVIDEFIKAMEAIDINAMKNAAYYARRKEIRQMLPRITKVLEKGMLSPARLQRYIDALKKSASGTKQTRAQLRMLQDLLDKSGDAKNLWRSSSAWRNIGRTLATDAAASYRNFVSGSADDLVKRLGSSYRNMKKFEKGMLLLSVVAATAEAYDRMEKGADASDAIARSSVNFVIDLVIAGIPITAAAEIGTQILFTSYAAATGDEGVGDATLSNTSKWVAEQALNQVADGAASLGEASIALERMVRNEPNIGQILGNVSYDRLRQSLSHVEDQIAALPPGHANEARLMRMRETFRILMRAKQQQG